MRNLSIGIIAISLLLLFAPQLFWDGVIKATDWPFWGANTYTKIKRWHEIFKKRKRRVSAGILLFILGILLFRVSF